MQSLKRRVPKTADHYARHVTKKIAIALLIELERALDLLQRNQKLGTLKAEGMRSYPFQEFPYLLVYRPNEAAGPQVFAVAHQSREPAYWRIRQ